jgi:hypothetical protein
MVVEWIKITMERGFKTKKLRNAMKTSPFGGEKCSRYGVCVVEGHKILHGSV